MNYIVGTSILGGLLFGLILDKAKILSTIMSGKSNSPLKRKNSLRKYSLRKNSGIPVSK